VSSGGNNPLVVAERLRWLICLFAGPGGPVLICTTFNGTISISCDIFS